MAALLENGAGINQTNNGRKPTSEQLLTNLQNRLRSWAGALTASQQWATCDPQSRARTFFRGIRKIFANTAPD
eukprot:9732069-Lingulodinium_polyedra.AAC.1